MTPDTRPDTRPDSREPEMALAALAEWPCQKYNPPHDCGRITGLAPLPCGPCTARAALRAADHRPDVAGLREALARHIGKSGWVRPINTLGMDHANERAWQIMQSEADGIIELIRPWLAAVDKPTPEPARGEPRTEVGRWLLDWDHNGSPLSVEDFRRRILDIERQAAALAAPGDEALRTALEQADADVSLIHDFLYGRGGTMDEAHAACWRIHDLLRPRIAAIRSRPAAPVREDDFEEDRRDLERMGDQP